jgi:hypothetical protein
MTNPISPLGPLAPLPKPSHAHRTGITKIGAPIAPDVDPTAPITIGSPVSPVVDPTAPVTIGAPVTPANPNATAPITKLGAPLTPDQTSALKRLHQATTQLEGVFLQMVMHEMSKSVPKDSLTGKRSSAEETFSGMLDDERAKAIAQTGTLGISKVLDQQLRASVLADAATDSKFDVNRELDR